MFGLYSLVWVCDLVDAYCMCLLCLLFGDFALTVGLSGDFVCC